MVRNFGKEFGRKLCLSERALTLCLLVSSADYLCKQFGPRSVLMNTLKVFLKDFSKKLIFEEPADDKEACKITDW